jgi:hypothetical protein
VVVALINGIASQTNYLGASNTPPRQHDRSLQQSLRLVGRSPSIRDPVILG